MKRKTVAIDRLACAITGAALIAAGGSAVGWAHGDLPVAPDSAVTMPWLAHAADAAWWPFALGAAGVVLIVVGLCWLFSHRPGQTLGATALPQSGGAGVLTVDINSAASAAADNLARHPHIVSASGTSLLDRGQRVIELDVKIDPSGAALPASLDAANATRRDLAAALDGVPVATRILLRPARSKSGAGRVV